MLCYRFFFRFLRIASCWRMWSRQNLWHRWEICLWQLYLLQRAKSASQEGPEEGILYSHFPAQILTKSHRPAQIPWSLCLSCSNLNPIPIFYRFFVDESQSQCMKSHFPSKKNGQIPVPILPLQDPQSNRCVYKHTLKQILTLLMNGERWFFSFT